VFVKVILSPSLAIESPVPASNITSSVDPLLSVNLIFSSSEFSPSTQETEYVVLVFTGIVGLFNISASPLVAFQSDFTLTSAPADIPASFVEYLY
jgi:hypothetical protein